MAISDILAPSMPCYLKEIGHAAEGCKGQADRYVGYKWFDRDIEDGGEFVCDPCFEAEEAVREAEYQAWCKELGLTP